MNINWENAFIKLPCKQVHGGIFLVNYWCEKATPLWLWHLWVGGSELHKKVNWARHEKQACKWFPPWLLLQFLPPIPALSYKHLRDESWRIRNSRSSSVTWQVQDQPMFVSKVREQVWGWWESSQEATGINYIKDSNLNEETIETKRCAEDREEQDLQVSELDLRMKHSLAWMK